VLLELDDELGVDEALDDDGLDVDDGLLVEELLVVGGGFVVGEPVELLVSVLDVDDVGGGEAGADALDDAPGVAEDAVPAPVVAGAVDAVDGAVVVALDVAFGDIGDIATPLVRSLLALGVVVPAVRVVASGQCFSSNVCDRSLLPLSTTCF
jgi:hypothetical protein